MPNTDGSRRAAKEGRHGCREVEEMIAFRRMRRLALMAATAMAFGIGAAKAQQVQVALGDTVSVETLCVVIALERAKERGVDYKLTSFSKEDLAIQAVVNGQADMGVA